MRGAPVRAARHGAQIRDAGRGPRRRWREKYADELADLGAGEQRVAALEAEARAASAAYAEAAAALSNARQDARARAWSAR